MFDEEFETTVTMIATSRSDDPDFPSNRVSITFDATDAHMGVMLRKFQDLLNAMGYVTDGRHLELVDGHAI